MNKQAQGAAGFQPLASIFGDDDNQEITQAATVTEADIDELFPFRNHPFQVRDDEEMDALTESIEQNGILVPLIVRPRKPRGYEIIAGHRRRHGGKRAGLKCVPIDIRDVDDDTAILMMVNTNCQRERVLPSERAFAYKMMLEAIKRQGQRTDLTCGQVGHMSTGKKSVDVVADRMGESRKQIQRYIRLTGLDSELLDLVDIEKLPMNTAVELSYLRPDEQKCVFTIMGECGMKPSMIQATHLKEESIAKPLAKDDILSILTVEKAAVPQIKLTNDIFKRYFPKGYTQEEVESVILSLLEKWAESMKAG